LPQLKVVTFALTPYERISFEQLLTRLFRKEIWGRNSPGVETGGLA
jgi:hypothetical protein